MSTTPSTARGTGRATSQTSNSPPLDKAKKMLPDWDKAKKATTESLKQLQNMDSHFNKMVKIIDEMTDADTQAALVEELVPFQVMLDDQLDIKTAEMRVSKACMKALQGDPPGNGYIKLFVAALNNAPGKMTIDQFKDSLTANMVAGEAHKKPKSKALGKGDQNAPLMSKPEQESKSTKKLTVKQLSVFNPKPNNIRMVTKKVPPPTKKAEPTTKKTDPTKKVAPKLRPSKKQLDVLLEDSEEDPVSKSSGVDPKVSLSPPPEKTHSAPVASGSKYTAKKSEAAVVETAPLYLEADSTKHKPKEYIPVTASSPSEKAEKKPPSSEMSAEPADPSARTELKKRLVVVTADTEKDKGGESDSSAPKSVALIAGGRKARRTFGMPGVAIPVPKKKGPRKPVKEPQYDEDDSDSGSETKGKKNTSEDEAEKSAEKVEEAEKDNGSKQADGDNNAQENTDSKAGLVPEITEKDGNEDPLPVGDERDKALASSEEGKSTQLPVTPETDTTQADVQIPEANDKLDNGHGSKETGAGSAPRDHSRQAATKNGSKRKHAGDHDRLPSKRPAIEGRNIASPRIR